jgi:hypothetical protein
MKLKGRTSKYFDLIAVFIDTNKEITTMYGYVPYGSLHT